MTYVCHNHAHPHKDPSGNRRDVWPQRNLKTILALFGSILEDQKFRQELKKQSKEELGRPFCGGVFDALGIAKKNTPAIRSTYLRGFLDTLGKTSQQLARLICGDVFDALEIAKDNPAIRSRGVFDVLGIAKSTPAIRLTYLRACFRRPINCKEHPSN